MSFQTEPGARSCGGRLCQRFRVVYCVRPRPRGCFCSFQPGWLCGDSWVLLVPVCCLRWKQQKSVADIWRMRCVGDVTCIARCTLVMCAALHLHCKGQSRICVVCLEYRYAQCHLTSTEQCESRPKAVQPPLNHHKTIIIVSARLSLGSQLHVILSLPTFRD